MQAKAKNVKIILDKQNCILKRCDTCQCWLPAFPHVFPVTDGQQLERACWQCWERSVQQDKRQHVAELITVS